MIVKHEGKLGLSDDSHGKHAVGLNYDRLAGYLGASGITQIHYLARCEPGDVGARAVRPVLVEGDWKDDPFWDRLRGPPEVAKVTQLESPSKRQVSVDAGGGGLTSTGCSQTD